MKKTLKILSLIGIFISIAYYAYADDILLSTSYEAEEYIIKIENINEEIERIDLVNFEECDMEETGWNYTTNIEIVPLFGENIIDHLDKHDTENYYIKQNVRYNYLAGRAAKDIEHTVSGGKYFEEGNGTFGTLDWAITERFKNEKDFYDYCNLTYETRIYELYKADKESTFICVKTTNYTPYKLTPIKEISLSNIENNTLTYNLDDFSNSQLGIRIKNTNGEYKTFISGNISMIMGRFGGNPILDKEKITIFDYQSVTYKDNSQYSFKLPIQHTNQWIPTLILIAIILFVIVVTLLILNIILKKKKLNKN